MTLNEDYHGFCLVKNEEKRDLIKTQRNFLIKIYEITIGDITELNNIAEGVRKRWIELQQKPKPLDQINQFKERCIESEIQTYQLSLERINRKIKEFNEDISYKIIQCNTQLGYDEIDLDSDYEDSKDKNPTESGDEENSDRNSSDDDYEEGEIVMSPIPYPCCNGIHCICYDQIEVDKEYEEYCYNYNERY